MHILKHSAVQRTIISETDFYFSRSLSSDRDVTAQWVIIQFILFQHCIMPLNSLFHCEAASNKRAMNWIRSFGQLTKKS